MYKEIEQILSRNLETSLNFNFNADIYINVNNNNTKCSCMKRNNMKQAFKKVKFEIINVHAQ